MNRTDSLTKRALSALSLVGDRRRFLDVGCWDGSVDFLIGREYPDSEITAIDILKKPIEKAKDRYRALASECMEGKKTIPKMTFMQGNFEEMKFDQTFDCALFLETIEHIDNPGAFLKKFHEALAPEGILIVSTPNALSLQNRFRHFQNLKKRLERIKDEPLETEDQNGHIASYDLLTLARLLDRNGFKYVDHKFVGLFIPITRSRWLNFGILENLFPSTYRNTIILKAVKK
jgi:2-polyprenyl-3-methyl-5-hydroxy-6-metoxy-1,4-benzoquinol methylase